MNSKQRRKAYRALPAAGSVMTIQRPYRGGPETITARVRVLGLTVPVDRLGSTADEYTYDGGRPSTFRVQVETIPDPFDVPARLSPLTKRLARI